MKIFHYTETSTIFDTSLSTCSAIQGGISLTHTLHSKTAEAFLANWCAAAFASLLVWATFPTLKQRRLNFTPSITFDMDHSTESAFIRADTTSWESLSISISFKPKSQATLIPSYIARAFVSSAFSGSLIRLLIVPIIQPFSFLITTPIP